MSTIEQEARIFSMPKQAQSQSDLFKLPREVRLKTWRYCMKIPGHLMPWEVYQCQFPSRYDNSPEDEEEDDDNNDDDDDDDDDDTNQEHVKEEEEECLCLSAALARVCQAVLVEVEHIMYKENSLGIYVSVTVPDDYIECCVLNTDFEKNSEQLQSMDRVEDFQGYWNTRISEGLGGKTPVYEVLSRFEQFDLFISWRFDHHIYKACRIFKNLINGKRVSINLKYCPPKYPEDLPPPDPDPYSYCQELRCSSIELSGGPEHTAATVKSKITSPIAAPNLAIPYFDTLEVSWYYKRPEGRYFDPGSGFYDRLHSALMKSDVGALVTECKDYLHRLKEWNGRLLEGQTAEIPILEELQNFRDHNNELIGKAQRKVDEWYSEVKR